MAIDLYLGIDTSNYTTSVALVDSDDNILEDSRIRLKVEDRMKGLRQSEALFQHWGNLPDMVDPIVRQYGDRIACVCVSTKPRPIEGSYMPVFRAGYNSSQMIASSLGVELFESTHQEGHIKAASIGQDIDFHEPLLCAHISGGTLEVVELRDGQFNIVGGTKDISYGKLLDRLGVDLGFRFPAGAAIDKMAMENVPINKKNPFVEVFIDKTSVNLSGLETQLVQAEESFSKEDLAYYAMERISESFVKIAEAARKQTGIERFLVTGGIASSRFLRKYCEPYGFIYGKPELCSDNAVGVAALKGKKLWD
ncbi:MAG: hypothetical protein IKR93_03730 [Firmicutes bacterium]|nr:hypothetical protein [Bacillota bacterium]